MSKSNEFLNEIVNVKVDPLELSLCRSEVLDTLDKEIQDEIKLSILRDPAFSILLDRAVLLISAILSTAKLFESDKNFEEAIASMLEVETTGVNFQDKHVALICKQLINLDLNDIDSGDTDFAIRSELDTAKVKERIQRILLNIN